MWKIKLEKIAANLFDIKASKIVHEWNGHIETVGRPEVMETSKQYLLLRTDVLKSGWVSLYYRCASMVSFLFIAYLIVSGSNALSGWPMKETLSSKWRTFRVTSLNCCVRSDISSYTLAAWNGFSLTFAERLNETLLSKSPAIKTKSIDYRFPVMMFIVSYKCFNNRKLIFALSVVTIIRDCMHFKRRSSRCSKHCASAVPRIKFDKTVQQKNCR